MLRLPRKWVMVAGLLAAVPGVAKAGPFDFLKPKAKTIVAGQSERTNQQVANDVAAALKKAKLKGFDISIEVKQGVATLSGKISDEQQRALATKAVNQVEGVESVVNRLELVAAPERSPIQQVAASTPAGPNAPQARPAGRSNQQVAQQIADSLVSAGLGSHDLEVRYKDGQCSIAGELDSPEQAAQVYQLAASVPEVQKVIPVLTVAGKPFNPRDVRPTGYNQAAMQQMMQQPGGYPGGPAPGPMPQLQQTAMMQQAAMQQAAMQQAAMQQAAMMQQAGPPQPGGPVQQAGFPGQGYPGHGPNFGGLGPHEVYNSPNLPQYAWPSQAAYDNYAAVTYPSQYDASAWPYIGPFYPYPQVPLGWRSAQLVWDDGYWNLKFNSRTDKWWWFLNPSNWD